MPADSWPRRVGLTIARQTPPYRAARLGLIGRLQPARRTARPASFPGHQTLVGELSRRVVERVARTELPSFRVVSEAYFARPRLALAGGRRRSGLLGWSGRRSGNTVTRFTPAVLEAVSDVTGYLVGEIVRATGSDAESAAEHVRRLFSERGLLPPGDGHGGASTGPGAALTDAQRAAVERIVTAAALRGGLSQEAAMVIRDAVLEMATRNGHST